MERPIAELNEQGEVVRCYANITSASEHLEMGRASITSRCNGLTKSSPFLKWYYDVPSEKTKGKVKMQRPQFRHMEDEIDEMEREFHNKLNKLINRHIMLKEMEAWRTYSKN